MKIDKKTDRIKMILDLMIEYTLMAEEILSGRLSELLKQIMFLKLSHPMKHPHPQQPTHTTHTIILTLKMIVQKKMEMEMEI